MKVLIGVTSCENDATNGTHDAIRATWASRMVSGLDYKIFMGRGSRELAPDEERLDVPDGPDSVGGTSRCPGLCEKTQGMRRWALERDYDFMFKADSDTYLSPKRLLASGFERYDYVGYFPFVPTNSGLSHFCTPEGLVPSWADARGAYIYASGGCGFWLSKRSMEAMVAAPFDDKRLDAFGYPAEDLWVPNVLFPLGIRGYHNPRYQFMGDRLVGEGISVHLGCKRTGGGTRAEWLYRAHASALAAGIV